MRTLRAPKHCINEESVMAGTPKTRRIPMKWDVSRRKMMSTVFAPLLFNVARAAPKSGTGAESDRSRVTLRLGEMTSYRCAVERCVKRVKVRYATTDEQYSSARDYYIRAKRRYDQYTESVLAIDRNSPPDVQA